MTFAHLTTWKCSVKKRNVCHLSYAIWIDSFFFFLSVKAEKEEEIRGREKRWEEERKKKMEKERGKRREMDRILFQNSKRNLPFFQISRQIIPFVLGWRSFKELTFCRVPQRTKSCSYGYAHKEALWEKWVKRAGAPQPVLTQRHYKKNCATM